MTVQELEAHPEREESLLCAVVEVALESPPLLVARLDDPRARLPQLDQLGAQLRLQALVFQCKSCCRADRLQQPRLVEQITVVDQHRETIPEIGDPTRAVGRHGEFATLLVHPDTTLRQPQPKHKRRVTQRARERITYLARLDLTKLDDQIGDSPASVPHPRETKRRGGSGKPETAPPAEVEPIVPGLVLVRMDRDVGEIEGVGDRHEDGERQQPPPCTGARAAKLRKENNNDGEDDRQLPRPPNLVPDLQVRPAVTHVEVGRHLGGRT